MNKFNSDARANNSINTDKQNTKSQQIVPQKFGLYTLLVVYISDE